MIDGILTYKVSSFWAGLLLQIFNPCVYNHGLDFSLLYVIQLVAFFAWFKKTTLNNPDILETQCIWPMYTVVKIKFQLLMNHFCEKALANLN
jgi:hypothetical protein